MADLTPDEMAALRVPLAELPERWLPTLSHPLAYEVSTTGRVRSVPRFVKHSWGHTRFECGRYMAPVPDGAGYLYLHLSRGGRRRAVAVHTLVLEAFVGPCPAGMECRHLDSDPGNNRIDNLEWATRLVNANDRVVRGSQVFGYEHVNAKLDEYAVRAIRAAHASGQSVSSLARQSGVALSTMQDIIHRRSWRHVG